MLLPLAVFTADDEQIFTVTLDFPVQACKNASLSLAMLRGKCCIQCRADRVQPRYGPCLAAVSGIVLSRIVLFSKCQLSH